MLRSLRLVLLIFFILVFCLSLFPQCSDVLQEAIGYTIVNFDYVIESYEDVYAGYCVKIGSGLTFEVYQMVIEPLPMSSVIILAKKLPIDFKKVPSVPEYLQYSYFLLINDELYSAAPRI